MDVRLTWTDCDEAGDYVVPNVLSPRDLFFIVSRSDNMDETVLHVHTLSYILASKLFCFDLFDLLLYVHGKYLRSCRGGQFLNHTVPKHPEAVYQYLVPILSPETDNLLLLNQRKRGINFPR